MALTVGFGLGAWLLLHVTLGLPLPGGSWLPLVQAHGHAQLVGFAGILVMGIGYRILPRFRSTDDPSSRLVLLSYVAVVAGLVARVVAQPLLDIPPRSLLLFLSGALELGGGLVYAAVVLRTLSLGSNAHRADEVLLAAAAAWFPIGLMWSFVALVPAMAGSALADGAAGDAATAALLLGFAGGHVIGVSSRVAPAFIAAPPASTRTILLAGAAWNLGVFGLVAGYAPAAWVALASAIALTWTIGPFRRGVGVAPLSAGARATRLAFRSAYAWLVVGLAMLALSALRGASFPEVSAARHALALGFLTLMVFGVGARLVPALSGGLPLPVPALRWAILLVNAAVALRVAIEATAGYGSGPVAAALGASALLAYAGLVIFAAAAARSVRSSVRSFVSAPSSSRTTM